MTSIIATQNCGAANPNIATALPILSATESRFTADRIPAGTPMMNDRNSPAAASFRVSGTRSISIIRASCWLRTDFPKLPFVTSSHMKEPYCTMNGRLSPNSSLSFS